MVSVLTDINPKAYFPDAKHVISYAFSIGGTHYFRFNDHLNIPYERALTTLLFYRELDMNVDGAHLDQHTEACDKLFYGNPIDVYKLKQLNDHLRTRRKLPKDPELMYKLASVVFFDQNESPVVYDHEYGRQKIVWWKEVTSLKDFFMQKPMLELIPYLNYVGENLETFSQMITDERHRHLETLSSV